MNKITLILLGSFFTLGCSGQQSIDKHTMVTMEYMIKTIKSSNSDQRTENGYTFNNVEAEAAKKGNRSYDIQVVEKAKKTIHLTDQIINKIRGYQKELYEHGSTDLTSVSLQNEYMIEKGNGKLIISELKEYINNLSSISDNNFKQLYPSNVTINPFKDLPLITSMANLELNINMICNYEEYILLTCAEEVGVPD